MLVSAGADGLLMILATIVAVSRSAAFVRWRGAALEPAASDAATGAALPPGPSDIGISQIVLEMTSAQFIQ